MAILTPDRKINIGGVTVNEYLLTKHNPNKIDMPSTSMEGKILGVTVHNTNWITTAVGTTPAEQYTRATVNGNMGDVRVHFYVDDTCAWQNLPNELSGWHAADGDGNGNRRTIAIECIMSPAYNDTDKKSEDNCARLAAALLKKYGLGIDRLYTHNHWYSSKYCPAYILPHWNDFVNLVERFLGSVPSQEQDKKDLYRIRKTWDDSKSQIGAFANIEGAKTSCPDGYFVFDESGTIVYPAVSAPLNSKTNYVSVNIKQLHKGNTGKTVRVLQVLLISANYSCGCYGVDGDFGEDTKAAVLNYQRDNGLNIDGVVGKETWTNLLVGGKDNYA